MSLETVRKKKPELMAEKRPACDENDRSLGFRKLQKNSATYEYEQIVQIILQSFDEVLVFQPKVFVEMVPVVFHFAKFGEALSIGTQRFLRSVKLWVPRRVGSLLSGKLWLTASNVSSELLWIRA